MDSFEEMMRKAGMRNRRDDSDNAGPSLAPDIEAIRLKDALAKYQEKNTFKVGDIVRQKAGCRCYQKIGKNDMRIVVEVLDEPVLFEDDDVGAGSPYWRQPLDIIIGHIDDDQFVTFYADSRRFEHVPASEIEFKPRG